jgi:hypothetical protein
VNGQVLQVIYLQLADSGATYPVGPCLYFCQLLYVQPNGEFVPMTLLNRRPGTPTARRYSLRRASSASARVRDEVEVGHTEA